MVVALAIKFDDGGPVFFTQERVGRDFKNFKVIKFRTMKIDAPANGPSITTKTDPRVTRVGRLLRKLKIDELPQVFNVIRGDMSVVGSRPEVPKYVSLYADDYKTILQVKAWNDRLFSCCF